MANSAIDKRLVAALRSQRTWRKRYEAIFQENIVLKALIEDLLKNQSFDETNVVEVEQEKEEEKLVVNVISDNEDSNSDNDQPPESKPSLTPTCLNNRAGAFGENSESLESTTTTNSKMTRIFDHFLVIGSPYDSEEHGAAEKAVLTSAKTNTRKKVLSFFSSPTPTIQKTTANELSQSPKILFQYSPPSFANDKRPKLPSKLVLDLTHPNGIFYKPLDPNASMSDVNSVLLGPYLKRNDETFIFTYNDNGESNTGDCSGSTVYGLCVTQPRLILGGTFATKRVYCILTRSPHFQLIFKLVFDILAAQRIARFPVHDGAPGFDRHGYDTFTFLKGVVERFEQSVKPGENQEEFKEFRVCEHLPTIAYKFPPLFSKLFSSRHPPSSVSDWTQNRLISLNQTSPWSLPVLFSTIPMHAMLKILHLLLIETPTVLISSKVGVASSAVLGLAKLLEPLVWCGPMLPVLPKSLGEVVESPVPMLLGLVKGGGMERNLNRAREDGVEYLI